MATSLDRSPSAGAAHAEGGESVGGARGGEAPRPSGEHSTVRRAARRLAICFLATSELEHDPRAQKEARAAHEAGHDVTVVCRTYSGPDLGYRVVPTNVARRTRRAAKYVERLVTNVELARRAIACRPDIVHAANVDTLLAGWLACRATGARLLYDAYELWAAAGRDVGSIGSRGALGLERVLARRADAVVTVSPLLARRMAELLAIPEPASVMNAPWFVDTAGMPPGSWTRRFEGRKVVLHQGRYVPGRGLAEALLAAKHLPSDVVVAFRGYGPIEAELRELVRCERLNDRCFFLPPVPMHDLVQAAVGADLGLVLYAPVNENNTFTAPNKLFDYLMAGVPCVGSDMPFVREVLEREDVGLVFRPGDPEDLARAVTELLADPARLDGMKARCRACARRYAWENEAETLLAIYDRIASSAAGAKA